MQDLGFQTSLDASHDHPYPALEKSSSGGFGAGLASFVRWFTCRGNITVCLVALTVLILHLVILTSPPQPAFDEEHYVPEAMSFLHGEGMGRPEHAPLAKLFIASGIFLLGDSAVGWRVPSVAFGMAGIFFFYLICKRLVQREDEDEMMNEDDLPPLKLGFGWFRAAVFVPVLATILFAMENLSFVQSHVAMLDVFYVTLMLLGFLLYLRGRYMGSGIVMGLSVLAKPMAVLAVIAIIVHWVVTRRKELVAEVRFTYNALRGRKEFRPPHSDILRMMAFSVAVPLLWFTLLPLLEYPATHEWANPFLRTSEMLSTHTSLTNASYDTDIASAPWIWLVYPAGIFYWYTPRYIGSIGWTIWALAIPSMGYLIYETIRRRVKGSRVALFVLSWFLGVYLLLIPMELATDRLMYVFYFYPAVPAVTLAIAWGAWKLWKMTLSHKKSRVAFLWGLALYLLATVVTFVLMSPYGTGLVEFPQA